MVLSIDSFFNLVEAAEKGGRRPHTSDMCVQLTNEGPQLTDEAMVVSHYLDPMGASEAERAWEAFETTIRHALPEKHITAICEKYEFDFERKKAVGPLRARHVQLWSIATTPILTYDIKYFLPEIADEPKKKLRTRAVEDITPLINERLVIRERPHDHLLPTRPFYDPLDSAQEKRRLYVGLHDMKENAWLERVTKSISGKELEHKEIIPVPYQGGIAYYKVHAKVAGGGLIAYALKPIKFANQADADLPPPRLVFRPTCMLLSEEDMLENWKDNFYWDYGILGYTAAQAKLNALIADPKFLAEGQKLHVSGYSLGSVHAQYFIADHWEHVEHFTSYNSPDSDPRVVNRFAEKINRLPPKEDGSPPLTFDVYRTEGDRLQEFGGLHLGHGILPENSHLAIRVFVVRSQQGFRPDKLHQMRIYDTAENAFIAEDVIPDVIEINPPQADLNPDSPEIIVDLDESPSRDAYLGDEKPTVMRWLDRIRGFVGVPIIAFFNFFRMIAEAIGSLLGVKIVRSSTSYGVKVQE